MRSGAKDFFPKPVEASALRGAGGSIYPVQQTGEAPSDCGETFRSEAFTL